jgi:hypothetical protein
MAFIFKLVLEDGTPADPPRLDTAVSNWSAGDTTVSFASLTPGLRRRRTKTRC